MEPSNDKTKMLSVFTVAALQRGDKSTRDALLDACQKDGFIYLDYSHSPIEEVEKLYGVTTEIFNLPLEEKSGYHVKDRGGPELLEGYRETGLSTGPFEGKRDGFESYTVPRNVFLSGAENKLDAPKPLVANAALIQSSMDSLHNVGLNILSLLSAALDIDGSASLQRWHRAEEQSTTVLILLQYLPPSQDSEHVGHFAHTDAGTLSFVFSQIGGLQLCPPDKEQWEFVKPRDKMAIVNVGDSLTFMTGCKLPSVLHRVVPHPHETQLKQTLAYFLRPEYDAPLTDRAGKVWQSRAWHQTKCKSFRASREEQASDSVLTGRDGYLGLAKQGETQLAADR